MKELIEKANSFLYFNKAAFPCQFLIEVEEGYAKVDVEDQDSLDSLLNYCRNRSLHVTWTRALANEESSRAILSRFPGGKYVASSEPIPEPS